MKLLMSSKLEPYEVVNGNRVLVLSSALLQISIRSLSLMYIYDLILLRDLCWFAQQLKRIKLTGTAGLVDLEVMVPPPCAFSAVVLLKS